MATSKLLTSELPGYGRRTTLRKLVALLGTWLQKWCVNKTMGFQWTIMHWGWLLMNAWWARDLTTVKTERRSEITFLPSKSYSPKTTYLTGGAVSPLTLSTLWYNANLSKDSEPTVLTKSNSTHGLRAFPGTNLLTWLWSLPSYQLTETTSTWLTLKVCGTMKMKKT